MTTRSIDDALSPIAEEWEEIRIICIPETTEGSGQQANVGYHRQSSSPTKPLSPLTMTPVMENGHPRACTPSNHEIWRSEPFLGPIPRYLLWKYMLAYIKNRMIPINAVAHPQPGERRAIFWGSAVPNMSVQDYVSRLISYTHCSPSVFIVALVYMDRVTQKRPFEASLNLLTLHRLLISAVTLATAFLDDRTYSINHYARVGGVPSKSEMIRLEITFLDYLGHDLHVTHTPYQRMLDQLISLHADDENQILNENIYDDDENEGSEISDNDTEMQEEAGLKYP